MKEAGLSAGYINKWPMLGVETLLGEDAELSYSGDNVVLSHDNGILCCSCR